MRKHVGPQWELRAVLARRDLRFAFASPPSAPTLAYYSSYGDIRDQGTIQGASVNQNRFTLGAVPIAEVDGPKAPAAIGLIGHTAAETFGPRRAGSRPASPRTGAPSPGRQWRCTCASR